MGEYSPLSEGVSMVSLERTITREYDPNGNMIKVTSGTEATVVLTYDASDRLKSYTQGDIYASFTYDGEGKRVSKRSEDISTGDIQDISYLYDGRRILYEMDPLDVISRNVYGINLICRMQENDGSLAYYMYNGHGDVVGLLDLNGAIIAFYEYEAFGDISEEDGSYDNPYKFAGEYLDSETGFYLMGARYYSPGMGRWITEDPYKGQPGDPLSLNLYVFVRNSPLIYVDPTGLFEQNYEEGYSHPTSGTVTEGDTLTSIAEEIYGDASAYEALASMNEIVAPGSIYVGQRIDLPYIICYKDKYENEYWYKQIRFVEGVGITPDLFIGTVIVVVGVKVLAPSIDDMSLHTYTWFATHVGLKIVHYRALARQKITSTYHRIVKNIAPIREPMSTEGTPKTVTYSPANPGPLKKSVAETFSGATYKETVLTQDTTFYRVYGGSSGKVGSYMTRVPQNGRMQSQIDLALNPQWGNTAQYVTKVTVSKGTVIYEGTAASQIINGGAGQLIGGGNQVYIPEVNASWFK